jgi:hypothetical protein
VQVLLCVWGVLQPQDWWSVEQAAELSLPGASLELREEGFQMQCVLFFWGLLQSFFWVWWVEESSFEEGVCREEEEVA